MGESGEDEEDGRWESEGGEVRGGRVKVGRVVMSGKHIGMTLN